MYQQRRLLQSYVNNACQYFTFIDIIVCYDPYLTFYRITLILYLDFSNPL